MIPLTVTFRANAVAYDYRVISKKRWGRDACGLFSGKDVTLLQSNNDDDDVDGDDCDDDGWRVFHTIMSCACRESDTVKMSAPER